MHKKPTTKAEVIEALRATNGLVSHAARALNISDIALYARLKKNPDIAEELKRIREANLDVAESKLFELIRQGNLGAVIFYLKCIGKHRGYVEKQQVDLTQSDGPIVIETHRPE